MRAAIAGYVALAVAAAGTAINVTIYVADAQSWLNLGAAIFCGLLFVVNLVTWGKP